ncbi:hypothetical protein [Rhodococcus sp. (in: high G+C Gram-positive bacteria)]|uniref:hypothetical protein n=1 Tax=Rhodococcus sp. TaxID=1831 RepID=UPI001A2C6CA6|nr:hypothetical protein [Rhodococcus sp. (in: high G+C Gram-positive bacteria)]MBJ7480340.1 hypothetical protein [Rhodococcus sp. (in: high G+C Gram-positive bacteria)]
MPDYPPIDYFRDWPPIETHTDAEWRDIARAVVESSGVPDGDIEAMTLALKSSAAREKSIRDEYLRGWSAVEEEAHATNRGKE